MNMNEARFEGKVNDLVKEVGGMSNFQCGKLAMLTQKARTNHEKLKKSVNSLQDSLDYLRICIKYQLFDLEATRRENEYLKKILNEKNK